MIDLLIHYIFYFEELLWGFLGVPLVLLLGIVLTVHSKAAQVRKLPQAIKIFISFFKGNTHHQAGISPIKAFFACIGGSVGVGNVVGVGTAIQIGGPGALFWLWVIAVMGAIIKYSEVYLGMKYREIDAQGNYMGGPMIFLPKFLKNRWLAWGVPRLICGLMCLYGVEIFQFSVVTKNISSNLGMDLSFIVGALLLLILFAGSGGVKRVGNISSALIPVFVLSYVGMGVWILMKHSNHLPDIFMGVLEAAFSGHAAIGGFVGSSLLSTVSQGIRRGCYTGDIGIGYASIIHSETSETVPEKQASLVLVEIFIDAFFICTTSVALVLVTGVWQESLDPTLLVQTALGKYFPYMHYFMPFFLFLVGYATINAYFCVGLKCAEQLMPRLGKPFYFVYAVSALITFSFVDTTVAQSVMAVAGGLLLVINSVGIFIMRKEISFDIPETKANALVQVA